MSCEHALNFDQWKTFSKNYKPISFLPVLNCFLMNFLMLPKTFSQVVFWYKKKKSRKAPIIRSYLSSSNGIYGNIRMCIIFMLNAPSLLCEMLFFVCNLISTWIGETYSSVRQTHAEDVSLNFQNYEECLF